jgi:hypothetical protein
VVSAGAASAGFGKAIRAFIGLKSSVCLRTTGPDARTTRFCTDVSCPSHAGSSKRSCERETRGPSGGGNKCKGNSQLSATSGPNREPRGVQILYWSVFSAWDGG